MPFEHDWERWTITLRELDLVLLRSTHLHNALPFLDHKGRARGSVLDLAVGPREDLLGMLHHFDLR